MVIFAGDLQTFILVCSFLETIKEDSFAPAGSTDYITEIVMSTSNPVPKIYRAVIDDVIKNVREAFLNEGVDDQVLKELKQLWESKLLQSRAIEFMPADVNVRVSLTYPHNMPQMQGINHERPGPSQASQAVPQSTTHLMQNQSGQLVYVSSHPTLGNVGPMTDAGAQAVMALQNAPRTTAPLMPQQIHGIPQAQVIHVQTSAPHHQQPNMFPGFHGARVATAAGPTVIYTPNTQQQHQQQPLTAHVKQPVIQVDGAADNEITNSQCAASVNNKKILKQSQNRWKNMKHDEIVIQLDGNGDLSSDELDDDDEDFDQTVIPGAANAEGEDNVPEEDDEPLNSSDDVSDEDPTDLFDTDNVVVCQYDKIARTRNRWKFHLKDGIMNLKSRDFVFHKANGDSEW
ncbi:TFIIA-alpha and beta-like factor isoform X2 [Hydractinia symbiolongicarpus]|uniref:TFIIA-alpha and beta-like factor isoform X2 n=1 Tax=Hydractinia symbiolongicarpus TaxID=13093 RepID=UPI00254ABFC0|nr:TFIIA-alpha and beta-like factor isoform X2 [Hydractinia symbiolongicarpus]